MSRSNTVIRRRTPFLTIILAIVLVGLLGALAWTLRRENAVLANARRIKDVKYYADLVQWIDNRRLIYSSQDHSKARLRNGRFPDVFYSLDAATGVTTQLAALSSAWQSKQAAGSEIYAETARFSPDGKWVALSETLVPARKYTKLITRRPARRWLMSVDGTRQILLPVASTGESVWSYDGTRLLLFVDIVPSAITPQPMNREYRKDLYEVSLSDPTRVTRQESSLNLGSGYVRALTSDNKLIVWHPKGGTSINGVYHPIDASLTRADATTHKIEAQNAQIQAPDHTAATGPRFFDMDVQRCSPDGTKILWVFSNNTLSVASRFGLRGIMPDKYAVTFIVTDASGKVLKRMEPIFNRGLTNFSSIQWQPDSRHISFEHDGGLFVTDLK